jgi:hypothetical protein
LALGIGTFRLATARLFRVGQDVGGNVPKRGPKTEAGRKAVRQNARTHGIFSELAVIPGVESEEEWRAHLEGVIVSFEPGSYMEQTLVERIALLLWRTRRVAWFERSALELSQHGVSIDHGSTLLDDMLISDRRAIDAKRLFPEPGVLERVIRYETHLHRQLVQTMHELEALQARRRGEVTQLARLDVTVGPTDGSL